MTRRVFLRIEGMNMSTFVEDTQDLSTIRGGSLLLLHAMQDVERVEAKLKEFCSSFERISTGASAGLFRCTLPKSMSPDCLRKKVERYLNHEDKELCHATFVVDVIEDLTEEGPKVDFVIHRERLLALNRWQQMQAPTLAVPKKIAASQPCAFDGVRPATKTSKGGELISESVWVRNKYGREQKQSLYTKETGLTGLKFVNELDELSADPSQGRLHHKIAVIYLDGNKFGDKQNRLCTTPELQKKFDTQVKGYRQGVLRELLIKIKDKPTWRYQGQLLRMETLLWGGDELIWVVPAWKGFWTLGFFFDHTCPPHQWQIEGKNIEGKNQTENLTHAAGLVFCHHNAPIHRVTALARKLAGLAKEHSREANRVAYQILESFDHAGLDLKAVRERRCPKIVSLEELILDGDKMSQVFKYMNAIRGQLPRRWLYQVLKALEPFPENASAEDRRALLETIDKILKDLKTEALEKLQDCFSTGESIEVRFGAWVHLVDLWDYLQGEDTCPKNEKK